MELKRLVNIKFLIKSRVILLFLFASNFVLIGQDLPDFKSAIKLNDFINSSSEELRPVFNAEGTEMYYTRAYHPANVGFMKIKQNKDIWKSVKNAKGEWGTSVNLEDLNDETDNSIVSINKQNSLYVTSFDKKKKDLQYSIGKISKTIEGYSTPQIVHIPSINFSGDFTDFFISKDEKVLLISIISDKGYGKEDLYVSHNTDGEWSEPKNLGTYINTTEHEFAPYLSENKRFLYFTTTGRKGLGGGDVFVATRLDESWEYWSEPVNLGNVVNSPKMDCYFSVSPEGKYYVSSNRNKATVMDIYELSDQIIVKDTTLDLLTVKGYISDSITNEFLTSEITITDIEKDEQTTVLSNRSGFYTIKLEKGKTYNFNILRAPYHEENIEITTPVAEKQIEEFWQHFQLNKYEKGDKIELENLHFHTSTANLRDDSKPVLDKLITIMKSNKTMRIRIEGHTDNSGSKIGLIKLSQQRANTVKSKLLDAGIDKMRIKTRGFGGFKPLVPNDSEPNKRQNRRVEFVIL